MLCQNFCSNIITNALRKKNFYKEAIRVELISPDKKSDSNGSLFADWLKWDPLSSGEGDLQLDDIAKSLSNTTRASKSVKAIDFTVFNDSMLFNGGRFVAATEAIETSVATIKNSEKPGDLDLLAETDGNSLLDAASKDQISGYKSSQQLHLPTDITKTYTDSEDIRTFTAMTGEEMKNLNSPDVIFPLVTVERNDLQSEEHIPSLSLDAMLLDENVTFERSTVDSDSNASCASADTLLENPNVPVHLTEKSMSLQGSGDVLGSQNVATDEHTTEVAMKDQEEISASQNVLGIEQVSKSVDHTNKLVDHTSLEILTNDIKVEDANANLVPLLATSNDMKAEDFQSAASHGTSEEATVGKQEHTCTESEKNMVLDNDLMIKNNPLAENCSPPEKPTVTEHEQKEADSEGHRLRLASSPSAKTKAKQRTYGKPLLFPLKRLLNPLRFKKKAKKFGRKLKKSC
uniref:Uncharacterized protein LOC105628183 n=1 Tax=Rhizophora mucronata TaxID=61149 RepID=A0A2P2JCW0_RHIMU